MSIFLTAGVSYLLGSIPFGLILLRIFRGQDVRLTGSGNIGATNVARSSPALGIVTLVLDALKGLAAVALTRALFPGDNQLAGLAALCAIMGHMFPIWLRFRGGKGVATGVGVILPICWQAAALGVLLWLVVVAFWRYSSLGSIAAAVAMPIFVYVLYAPHHAPPEALTLGTVLISILVLVKHRSNMERLIAGEESRLKLGG